MMEVGNIFAISSAWKATMGRTHVLIGHFGGTLTHGSGYLTELIFAPVERLSPTHAAVVPASINISAVHFPADGKIDFARDVQPIFSHSCYECHGPTKRSGQLRLDNKQ